MQAKKCDKVILLVFNEFIPYANLPNQCSIIRLNGELYTLQEKDFLRRGMSLQLQMRACFNTTQIYYMHACAE